MGTSSADFLGRGLRRWLGAAGVLSGLAILSAPAEQAPALVISPDGQQIVLHWVAIPPPLCQPAPCLVRPKTHSSSPAQRRVHAGAKKTIPYQGRCC